MEHQAGCGALVSSLSHVVNNILTITELLGVCMQIGSWYLSWCDGDQSNKSSRCADRSPFEGYSSHLIVFKSVATFSSAWRATRCIVQKAAQNQLSCHHPNLHQPQCRITSSQWHQAQVPTTSAARTTAPGLKFVMDINLFGL
jgi:hypothetical protein